MKFSNFKHKEKFTLKTRCNQTFTCYIDKGARYPFMYTIGSSNKYIFKFLSFERTELYDLVGIKSPYDNISGDFPYCKSMADVNKAIEYIMKDLGMITIEKDAYEIF